MLLLETDASTCTGMEYEGPDHEDDNDSTSSRMDGEPMCSDDYMSTWVEAPQEQHPAGQPPGNQEPPIPHDKGLYQQIAEATQLYNKRMQDLADMVRHGRAGPDGGQQH